MTPAAPAAPAAPGGPPPALLISVVEIRRRPGTRLPVRQRMVASGLHLSDVAVPDGEELVFQGELESIHEGVVLTGAADVPWAGTCRRCLREVTGTAHIEVREVYETHPTDGETWPLVHDHVDLGPLMRDIALLSLPLAPLCGEDCRGPVPDVFPATVADGPSTDADLDGPEGSEAFDDEGRPRPPKDPRWAALDDLDL